MKRAGFSLWKGLWLIFVQSDIKTCSSLPSPCRQSDPQINTSDLVKFEESYKFYLSWQKSRRFVSCVAFTLYMKWWLQVGVVGSVLGLVHIWPCREIIMGTSGIASDFLDKTLYSEVKTMSRNTKSVEKVTLGQHGTIQRVQPNTENFLKPALRFLYLNRLS